MRVDVRGVVGDVRSAVGDVRGVVGVVRGVVRVDMRGDLTFGARPVCREIVSNEVQISVLCSIHE